MPKRKRVRLRFSDGSVICFSCNAIEANADHTKFYGTAPYEIFRTVDTTISNYRVTDLFICTEGDKHAI